jgi:1-acyl-sn-glycerol-3-phosphate acyltransferase
MIVIAGIIKLCSFCMKKKTLNSTSVLLVSYAWQLSLFLTPWMWVSAKKGYSEKLQMLNKQVIDRSNGVKGARPVFVLGNHTSFLDTILTITRLTTPIALESKTYMSSHLFKLPILSTICLGCGHFSVPYKGSGDDDFSIDKEKIAATQKLVDQHIEARGVLCFFPEGAMNGNPSEIRAIRYGGMKKALEYDAIIWTFVTNGNQVMWPRKAQIGGIPGYGQYNLKQIAPIGCRELVKQIRNENKNDGDINGKKDFVILSEYVRKKMQEEWDDLLDGSSQGSEEKKEK